MLALISPIFAISLCLYLGLSFFGNGVMVWIGSFLVGVTVSIWSLRGVDLDWGKKFKLDRESIFFGVVSLGTLAAIGFVLSPMVWNVNVEGHEFIRFPGLGDYYKHLYVMSSLSEGGLPIKHPFYPDAKFSYYFGYYLIPAAISAIFKVYPNWCFYIFMLLTSFISMWSLYWLYRKYLDKSWQRMLGIGLLLFGFGLDLIPTQLEQLGPSNHHIEVWSFGKDLGLIVNNVFVALLWVPQHFLAAVVGVLLVEYLVSNKKINYLLIVLSLGFIGLSSIFVAISVGFWLLLYWLFICKKRVAVAIAFIFAGVVLLPFVLSLGDRGSLIQIYTLKPYPFIDSGSILAWVVNLKLTFLFEYGLVFWIAMFLGAWSAIKFGRRWILFWIAIFAPVLISWFVRSEGNNDLGMRVVLMSFLVLPGYLFLVWNKVLGNGKGWIWFKVILIGLIVANLIVGAMGFGFEYLGRWRERRVFALPVSEVILKLRDFDKTKRIGVIEDDEWVFLIPSMGFRVVDSLALFDSAVYIVGDDRKRFSEDFSRAKNVFSGQVYANSSDELRDKLSVSLAGMRDFVLSRSYDELLINKQVYVKHAINPWYEIFAKVGASPQNFVETYYIFNKAELLSALDKNEILVDSKNKLKVVVDKDPVFIKEGLWFVVACREDQSKVMFELEDYFAVLDANLNSDKKCLGRLFYAPVTGGYNLGYKTNVKEIEMTPVVIQAKR